MPTNKTRRTCYQCCCLTFVVRETFKELVVRLIPMFGNGFRPLNYILCVGNADRRWFSLLNGAVKVADQHLDTVILQ